MYLTMLKKYKVLSKVLEQTSIHKIESTIYLLCDCCTRLHDQFIGKYPNYNFKKKYSKTDVMFFKCGQHLHFLHFFLSTIQNFDIFTYQERTVLDIFSMSSPLTFLTFFSYQVCNVLTFFTYQITMFLTFFTCHENQYSWHLINVKVH